MGVPGLWDILRPAGKQRSLAQLALHDGFERNPGGRRGLRVGIDASIWFYHATYGREGENPELRLLFFRCARLMSRPFLPLFVFDGPGRPELKRKKKISGKDHWMVSGMQEIIEAFGFEWWCAPGEAEAELAYLNKIGVIDAIITDDVDTFVFGATTIIRNPGKLLSGNNAHPVKNNVGKDDSEHTYTYNSTDILDDPDVALSHGGMILIALLRGGDYDPTGVVDCGPNVARALARCGFGDTLLEAARNLSRERLSLFLQGWRTEIRAELRSNSRKFLKTKRVKLAETLPDSFPNIDVLDLYTNPETSERKGKRPTFLWEREPDLMKLAALCERKFEWGVREIIVKRFRTVMWEPIVLRILRRSVLDAESAGPSTPKKKKKTLHGGSASPGSPSKMIALHFSTLDVQDEDDTQRLVVGIHGKREHASTDGILEYRLEIDPTQLVRLTEAGVQGTRIPPSQYRDDSDDGEFCESNDEDDDGRPRKAKKKGGPKVPPPSPDSHLRIWMPACIVARVEPDMVDEYENRIAQKVREKEDKAARKAARLAGNTTPRSKSKAKTTTSRARASQSNIREVITAAEEEEEELSAEEDFSNVFGLPLKSRSKSSTSGVSNPVSRAKSKLKYTLPEEEEEEEELSPIISKPRRTFNHKAKPLSEATNSGHIPQQNRQVSPKGKEKAMHSEDLPAPAQMSKRKTILDLLDERRPSKNVTSSTISLPDSGRLDLRPSCRRPTPEPFPLSQKDKDVDEEKRNQPSVSDHFEPVSHRRDEAKRVVRSYSVLTSESDGTLSSSPKKSPRKSRKHDSPSSSAKLKSIYRTPDKTGPALGGITKEPVHVGFCMEDSDGEHLESDEGGRPLSPSPLRPKLYNTKGNLRLTATLSSRPGAPEQSASSSNSFVVPGPASRQHISQPKPPLAEIIEITSDSESENEKPRPGREPQSKKPLKSNGPPKARHVSSGKISGVNIGRVDALFPTIKPKNTSTVLQKGLSKGTGPANARISRQPRCDVTDVIEIL